MLVEKGLPLRVQTLMEMLQAGERPAAPQPQVTPAFVLLVRCMVSQCSDQ